MDESSLLKKILFNKGYVISIVLKYKSTYITFSNFIINHPENNIFDKYTFLNNNINVNIPRRKKSSSQKNVNIPEKKCSPNKNHVDILDQKSMTIFLHHKFRQHFLLQIVLHYDYFILNEKILISYP